jgi:hypothetical protein
MNSLTDLGTCEILGNAQGVFKLRANRNSNRKEAMRNSKFGLRAFGLAIVAALGLMAFTAVAAQAENLGPPGVAGKFTVNNLEALAKPGVTFEANQENTGTLLVPGRGFDILCEKSVIVGEFKSSDEALGSAQFTKCSTWVNVALGLEHKEKIPCTVVEPIEVKKGKILPKKHESAPYVLIEEDGEAFTEVKFSGTECTLPPTNKVTGSVVGAIVAKTNNTKEPLIEFSEEIQKLFQTSATVGDHLKYGTFEAYIDANTKVKLTDTEHVGMTIAVI